MLQLEELPDLPDQVLQLGIVCMAPNTLEVAVSGFQKVHPFVLEIHLQMLHRQLMWGFIANEQAALCVLRAPPV